MEHSNFRIVLDTNAVLRGIVSVKSSSARVLRGAENRAFVPLLSKPVLDEYRAILGDPAIVERFPALTSSLVEVTIRRLRYVADYVRVPMATFGFDRDARDSKFIELAIAMAATHILSFDHDLLTLPTARSEAGRRFRQRLPGVLVLRPDEFITRYADAPR